ncbi:MAG: hypothetical protein KIT35_12520 [Piscinibacter sp.]|uniref:hypothetical protein n=1 Tax=Piscinibacter sp. TaxID=1903157 RepID=UPI00258A6EA8|nr:hypothetical protein [Piscinibacter sp.]MCW5664653.1 hypothetical protein [Piscinibacter sp.]
MDPDLSEFSFGFALTSELIARHKLKRAGAPVFATQLEEAKPGGGWDMKLPALPIYLQFKRSDRMVLRTAKHAAKFASMPFYRMHLRRSLHSQQHQLLLDLENKGNHVFYAAPGFSTSEELSDAYVKDQMTKRSLFVSPSAIGKLKDDKAHHVAFQLPGPVFFCSEPVRINPTDIDALLSNVVPEQATSVDEVDANEFFRGVADDLLSVYESRESVPQQRRLELQLLRERREPAEFAGLIARTLFDVDLLVATRADA